MKAETSTEAGASWDADPILSVEHLTMRFGGLVAINDLSFSVGRGDITALIGPNGAGKTTVFNCITGFYKPTEGRIVMRHGPGRQQETVDRLTLTGKKWEQAGDGSAFLLERMPDFEIAKHAKVARTFQNIRLFGGMTVLENLLVAQHNRLMVASNFTVGGILHLPGFRKAEGEAIDKAIYWLERVKLIDRADDPAADLPYGDQRRLEIARAMCTEPHLLCLDEPAAGLNPRESAELNALLQYIRKEHDTSVLLIEHDMGVVMEISDHIVVLDYGVKISDGDAAFVRNDPSVIAAYLGVEDEEIEEVPEVASLVVEALGEEAAVEAGIEAPAIDPGEALAAVAESAAASAPESHPGKRPAGLDKPQEGGADDLTRIKGIGPVNARKLNGLGIWHFAQIAAWRKTEVEWVGSYLSFPGRIEREDWVGQAKGLAKSGAPRKKGKGKTGKDGAGDGK
ncbi:MAG: ATP-binding cassette domain-containing protein [Aquamicrobium sp.]|jgi:branched-chain amino acid transport system ATP-binding protein|uniref:ATP-binding cassette domain-containing protein n=1 Tax=Aquamicrobium sp. TaxID=1872579 RepID=UPI00349E993A|nr:ATP-binding cassette domain-containing protein [Aquamicrobium sp.]